MEGRTTDIFVVSVVVTPDSEAVEFSLVLGRHKFVVTPHPRDRVTHTSDGHRGESRRERRKRESVECKNHGGHRVALSTARGREEGGEARLGVSSKGALRSL